MALTTNTFPTYSAIGNREDLSNEIYMVAPFEAPILSNLQRSVATATLHEWQTQGISAAAANAQLEGDQPSNTSLTASVRRSNRIQISRYVPSVTGTQQAVAKAGRENELSYQVYLMSLRLIRDMELDITSNTARVVGNSTTAPVSAGLGAWIATNDVFGTSGVSPTGDGTDTRTDGTTRAFQESFLGTALQNTFTSGGNPTFVSAGAFNKRQLSALLSGGATRFKDSEDKSVIAAVDIFVSDFGRLEIWPNRFQRDRDLWCLDLDFAAIAYLKPFHSIPLAKDGDYEREMLQVYYCLEMRNEAAHTLVADLTAS